VKPVVTAAEMRALDRATIDQIGIPAMTLMETAGRAVAAAVTIERGHVAVVCGPGNNGGDGFVVARVLRERGLDAVAYLAVARDAVKGDAKAHLDILERAGGIVRSIATPAELDDIGDAIATAAVCVDALFGIGLARPIEGHLAEVVAQINAAADVVAIDIPSGLDTDTGKVLGTSVLAHRTVTMAAHKIALASAPGFARCGEVIVADIGIPSAVVATQVLRAGLVDNADVTGWLPRTKLLDHKGTRGHVLVIGGNPGMRGAGRLAATAALRVGAGLCTLAAEGSDLVAPDPVMTRVLSGELGKLADGKSAVVIGCGLGRGDSPARYVDQVLASGVPAVIDADALNLHAGKLASLASAAGSIVLTPHPGEAARLLGTTTAEIEADRLAAARAIASASHAVVVLKGARTIVCDGTLGDEFCSINATGGPALGTGGSGDVLAGVIGGLLAQGLTAADAARAGVHVHGRAADTLSAVHGARGVISSDLPVAVAQALRDLAPE
jgi:ADP-dependent NAD(P)H-hydrate dehydratase / NAD(P)H-hydrate epimerase